MQTMEKPILERCPFCGCHADLEWDTDDIWVECRGCFAKGPAYGRGISDAPSKVDAMVNAINGWNRRDYEKKKVTEEQKQRCVEEILKRGDNGV